MKDRGTRPIQTMRRGEMFMPLAAIRWIALGGVAIALSLADTNVSHADDMPAPWTSPVPKAKCGPGSRAESGLQGSTSLAERFGGASAQGFRCNMELVGQWQGEGASWQMAWF